MPAIEETCNEQPTAGRVAPASATFIMPTAMETDHVAARSSRIGHAKLRPMDNPADDNLVIESVLAGSVDTFEILIERYQRLVFSIAGRHVPPAHIQEVAHETFILAYRDLAGLRDRTSFKAWLSALTVRRCYDFWRRRRRERELPMSCLSEEQQRWIDGVLQEQSDTGSFSADSARQAGEILRVLFSRLSAEDRMVITLVHIEERSTREAAALLGWSRANLKVRAFRARQRMKKMLAEILNEENVE